jgi:hypothetical protein
MKKIVKIVVGVGLILVGLVGLVMPVMPGWAFIIPGLVILAEYSRTVRRLLDWAKERLESVKTRTGGSAPPTEPAEVSETVIRADSRTDPIRDR